MIVIVATSYNIASNISKNAVLTILGWSKFWVYVTEVYLKVRNGKSRNTKKNYFFLIFYRVFHSHYSYAQNQREVT